MEVPEFRKVLDSCGDGWAQKNLRMENIDNIGKASLDLAEFQELMKGAWGEYVLDEAEATLQVLEDASLRERLIRLFMEGDADQSGAISLNELKELLDTKPHFNEVLRMCGKGDQLDKLFRNLDKDVSGLITLYEFVDGMMQDDKPVEIEEQKHQVTSRALYYTDGVDLPDFGRGFDKNAGASTINIFGKPRLKPVEIPSVHTRTKAKAKANTKFIDTEVEARRTTRVVSTNLLKMRGKTQHQFTLSPAFLHFSKCQVGKTKSKWVLLTNVSAELGRFNVKRPAAPLSVDYKHGFVAAGMGRKIKVSITPTQPGEFIGELNIHTEFNIFNLTVSANVMDENGELLPEASLLEATLPSQPAAKKAPEPELPVFDDSIELDENRDFNA